MRDPIDNTHFSTSELGIQDLASGATNVTASSNALKNDNTIEKLVYPEFLNDARYANRRVMFMATENSLAHFDTDELAKKIIKETKEHVASSVNKVLEKYKEHFSEKKTKVAIVLPLPDVLEDSQTHKWQTTEGVVYSILNTATNNIKDFLSKDVIGMLSDTVSSALQGIDADKWAGAIADTSGIRKPMLDPNYWQNYTGSEPRSLSFRIQFLPRNQVEAGIVREIIKVFKAYSSPSLMIKGVSLRSPHYWDIYIANQYISDMFRMDNLVLTNINVQYGADSKMALFYDGMPKSIMMNLQFTESHITYMENYLNDELKWEETI